MGLTREQVKTAVERSGEWVLTITDDDGEVKYLKLRRPPYGHTSRKKFGGCVWPELYESVSALVEAIQHKAKHTVW